MVNEDHTKLNQLAIMTLSMVLGIITPLLARRTYDGFFGARRHRILHRLNAVHNILYFVLTFATIIVKIYVPVDCWAFRFAQGIIFHVYVFLYELVLGLKAKAIIGNGVFLRGADLSVGTLLLLLSMSIRAFAAVLSLWHTEYEHVSEYGLCVNKFNQQWQDFTNYSRNILEILWSALFVIPLYRVVQQSNQAGAIAIVNGGRSMHSIAEPDTICIQHPSDGAIRSKSATAMRHLLVASMIFPFCASLISIAISIYMNLDTDIHPAWGSIMHGMQNFVSTLSVNLILNMRVVNNEPSQSEDYDHVRFYGQQMTSKRRYRDNESTDEWESTGYETSQSRKPSLVPFDLDPTFSIGSGSGRNNHVGDINASMNLKALLSSSRRSSCVPLQPKETPMSSRRASFVTTPSTSPGPHTTVASTNA